MGSEYFTLDMEISKLRDTIFICSLKTEAEVELMTKSEMVDVLNENCRKELKFRIAYPDIPESIDLKNNLDVAFTPSIPLNTITSPKNALNAGHAGNKNGGTFLPPLERDPSISYNNNSTLETKRIVDSFMTTTVLNVHSAEYKNMSNAIKKVAHLATNSKNIEYAANITQKCNDLSLPEKRKIVSDFRKEFNRWFENYVKELFLRYCGHFEDLSLIGTGSALTYDINTVHCVKEALSEALNIHVRIPCVDAKPILLLTPSKAKNLNSYICQCALQYNYYYRYVKQIRSNLSTDQIDKLEEISKTDIENIKCKKGEKKNIEKVLRSFHLTLASRDGNTLITTVVPTMDTSNSTSSGTTSTTSDSGMRKKNTTKKTISTLGDKKKKKKNSSSEEDEDSNDDNDNYSDEDDVKDKKKKRKLKSRKNKSKKKKTEDVNTDED